MHPIGNHHHYHRGQEVAAECKGQKKAWENVPRDSLEQTYPSNYQGGPESASAVTPGNGAWLTASKAVSQGGKGSQTRASVCTRTHTDMRTRTHAQAPPPQNGLPLPRQLNDHSVTGSNLRGRGGGAQ